jgi:hypothetical protein
MTAVGPTGCNEWKVVIAFAFVAAFSHLVNSAVVSQLDITSNRKS